MLIIILLLLSIGSLQPYSLTPEENENRLAVCGKFAQKKIYQGREAGRSEAPWSVLLQIHFGRGMGTCTGSIVSSRHILTASHCFSNLDLQGNREIYNGKFDGAKCDAQQHYTIEDSNVLDKVAIYYFNKNTNLELKIEKISLVEGCRKLKRISRFQDPMMASVDLAIIHLKEELKFGKDLGMACVAEHRDMEKIGTQLEVFSYGLNPPPNAPPTFFRYYQEPVMRHVNLTVISPPQRVHPHYFTAKDPNSKSTMCVGDSGGGVVGNFYGKVTVVGVFFGASGCGQSVGHADVTSVGHFSDATCKISGICEGDPLGEEILIPVAGEDEKNDEEFVRNAQALISSSSNFKESVIYFASIVCSLMSLI